MVDTPNGEKEIIQPAGIAFTVASRPQTRYSAVQSVNNFLGATSFAPIPLPATGFVRKVSLEFTATYTTSGSAAIAGADSPWNLISGITLTDATGQPIFQPISGYNLYLRNKYASFGLWTMNRQLWQENPHAGPEYTFNATGTSGTATFRLDLDLEIDSNTGYGSIPNLDANASLQLKVDVAPYTSAFTGGTASAASVSVRVAQYYWAVTPGSLGGQPVNTEPPGLGDYLETRYETQTVNASSENLVNLSNKGGLVSHIIAVSRNAGARTAFTANSNVGLVLDNNPINEGIRLQEHQDQMRRIYGYLGADVTTSYAPLSMPIAGLDQGVLVWNFDALSGGRDSWLMTKVGSLLQLRVTPGASATQLEIITVIGQIANPNVFYGRSAIN